MEIRPFYYDYFCFLGSLIISTYICYLMDTISSKKRSFVHHTDLFTSSAVPLKGQYIKALPLVCANALITTPIFFIVFNPFFKIEEELLPSSGFLWFRECSYILLHILIVNIFFYITHTLLHIKKFFYKLHHSFINPISISAIYCHPFEHFFINLLSVSIPTFLLPLHTATYYLWICMTTINAVYLSHRGYTWNHFDNNNHKFFNYNLGINVFTKILFKTKYSKD
jgi:sterol desaturase/sphingolipid hydroxylase (fatty acid hydroxylase superfamily)